MTAPTTVSIEVRRVIPAPVDDVFRAWIDPALLAQWIAPGELQASVDCFEPRVGGAYRVTMRDDTQGEMHVVAGKFLEIAAPHRLRMTWAWENDSERPSLVTVDFVSRDAATEVVVRHDRLSEEEAALHETGWGLCLDQLGGTVAAS